MVDESWHCVICREIPSLANNVLIHIFKRRRFWIQLTFKVKIQKADNFKILPQTHGAGESYLHMGDNFRRPFRHLSHIEDRKCRLRDAFYKWQVQCTVLVKSVVNWGSENPIEDRKIILPIGFKQIFHILRQFKR